MSSKLWRINQLFNSAQRFQRLQLSERDVLVPFLSLTAANVIILSCWTALDPLRFIRTASAGTDQWNRVVSSTGSCRSSDGHSGHAMPYLVALAVVNLTAVIFANIQAYRARNLRTEYSESRYIALIMVFLLQAYLTGLPVLALVYLYDMPRVNYIVITIMVLLTSMAILLLIFVPKINATRAWAARHSDRSSDEFNRSTGSIPSRSYDQGSSTIALPSVAPGLKVYRSRSVADTRPPLIQEHISGLMDTPTAELAASIADEEANNTETDTDRKV